MTMKKTIIFDLGGVLIDWNPTYYFQDVFSDQAELDFFLEEICSPAWNALMDQGKTFKQSVIDLSEEHPEYADQIQAYSDHWIDMIGGPIPDTVKILEELKEAGYRLAALSNWSAETFPKVAHRFEFLDWFDPLIISGEIGLIKPGPDIFHYILKELGQEASDCLFIDDNLENIQAAAELGFAVIRFSSPAELKEELQSQGILIRK